MNARTPDLVAIGGGAYVHEICFICRGRGSVAVDTFGVGDQVIERDQACRCCNGHGSILIEQINVEAPK